MHVINKVTANVAGRVFVASKNPAKLRAVQGALDKCFPDSGLTCEGIEVDSRVSAQPFGDDETLLGAQNRVAAVPTWRTGLTVAIEGGVCWSKDKQLECFAWVVAKSPVTGAESRARSASFTLPQALAQLVEGGMELGDADDKVFGKRNSKQGAGTIGQLTGGLITRQLYYEHAVVMALVPFMNPQLYPEFKLDL